MIFIEYSDIEGSFSIFGGRETVKWFSDIGFDSELDS